MECSSRPGWPLPVAACPSRPPPRLAKVGAAAAARASPLLLFMLLAGAVQAGRLGGSPRRRSQQARHERGGEALPSHHHSCPSPRASVGICARRALPPRFTREPLRGCVGRRVGCSVREWVDEGVHRGGALRITPVTPIPAGARGAWQPLLGFSLVRRLGDSALKASRRPPSPQHRGHAVQGHGASRGGGMAPRGGE